MKIKYVHAADPLLNGTETHLPAHVAAVLIATGAAVEIKYKSYVERLTEESKLRAAAPPVIEWGVKESDGSQFSQNMVIKKVGADTTYFSAPPDDCPESIKRRFAELISREGVPSANSAERSRVEVAMNEAKVREFNSKLPWEK